MNLKKFILLLWALNHSYKKIAGIDADTEATKSFKNLFDILSLNYKKNIYIGTSYCRDDTIRIVENCQRHFKNRANDIFRSTNGKIVYSWFFDVPFYESTDLSEFLLIWRRFMEVFQAGFSVSVMTILNT